MRRVSRVEVAWERLRARRKLGTAMAASKAMIATTIMISTRVKPERRDWSLVNIGAISGLFALDGLGQCSLAVLVEGSSGHASFYVFYKTHTPRRPRKKSIDGAVGF